MTETEDNINDYLNTFNKEIGDGPSTSGSANVGPAGDGPTHLVSDGGGSGLGQIEGINEETIQLIAQQAAASGHDGPITAQIASADGTTVQTVTLVPDAESGGYMLILQPNENVADNELLNDTSVQQPAKHHVEDDDEDIPDIKPPPKRGRGTGGRGRKPKQNDETVYDFEDHPTAEELDEDQVVISAVDQNDADGHDGTAFVTPKKNKRKLANSNANSAPTIMLQRTAHLVVDDASVAKKPKRFSIAMGGGSHKCTYCEYTSHKRYLLSRHMKSHSEERPHKCGICERGFKTLASLQNHVNTHTGVRPHKCKWCESDFTTSGELVRHVRYKHTHEKPHRCPDCEYASVELSKLKRHIRCHTGERPYQCPHCTYASPDTYKLKRHLRIHTGEKPYECDVCKARFTQSNSLKAHRLIHSGSKPVFKCSQCPTTCGRKTDLRIHVLKLHTSDRPITCKRCDQTFPDRYQYKTHLKSHEGEKCFKCDLCNYSSISQRHLESHMLIHTDQKPYQCVDCDQSFRQKQLLKRHVNLYHNPNYVPPTPKEKTHECTTCGKAFRHKGNLMRHLALHDPDLLGAQSQLISSGGVVYRTTDIHQLMEDEEEEDEEDESLLAGPGGGGAASLGQGGTHIILPEGGLIGSDGQQVNLTYDPQTNQLIQSQPDGTHVVFEFVHVNNDGETTSAEATAETLVAAAQDGQAAGVQHTYTLDNGQQVVISEQVANAIAAAAQSGASSKSKKVKTIKQEGRQEGEFLIQLGGDDDGTGLATALGEGATTSIINAGGQEYQVVQEGQLLADGTTVVVSNGGLVSSGRNVSTAVIAPPPPRVSDDTRVAREKQEKKKDLDKCFGFADDEEEDDAILQLAARDAQ